MNLSKYLLAATFAVFASSATSATVYDESANGDLDGIAGTSLGEILALGTNTIIGSLPGTPSNGPSHTDRFNLVLGAGLKIVAWTLNISLENGENVSTGLGFIPGNLFDDNFTSNLTGSRSASFTDSTGPDSGMLDGSLTGSVWDFTVNAGTLYGTQAYSISIVTEEVPTTPSTVPLPAGFPLLLGGLGSMAFLARRKKKNT